MGAVLIAVVVALVILGLLSLFDAAAQPPRSSTWQALGVALFAIGAGSTALAQLWAPLGALAVLGTLAVGACGGRAKVVVLAPAFYAGTVLVLTVFERDEVNYTYWFALAIGAPFLIALVAGLLAIAAALRVLRAR